MAQRNAAPISAINTSRLYRSHQKIEIFSSLSFPNRIGSVVPAQFSREACPVQCANSGKKGRVISLGRGEQVQRRHGDPVAVRVVGRLARTDQGTVAGDKIRYALPGPMLLRRWTEGASRPLHFHPAHTSHLTCGGEGGGAGSPHRSRWG